MFDYVGGSCDLTQALIDEVEYLVFDFVFVGVVDGLEMVDVVYGYGDGIVVCGAVECVLQV